MKVPFGDLTREMADCGDEIRSAVDRVLASGWFILGRELDAFERAFGEYLGAPERVVGVASGTEAIQLGLMAAGVEAGDFVVTVPNTAVPTASAITAAGATLLLVDVAEDGLTMDPEALRDALARERPRLGNRLKAVVPVHLYGQCADMDPILEIAREFDLAVVEDACQAHGATYRGRQAGTIGDFGAFSFYPSKNLGCYGDGGAVVAQRPSDVERLRMLRNYGQSRRYYHDVKGINSRLDEIQAAILSAKLPHLGPWIDSRRRIAEAYAAHIGAGRVRHPSVMGYGEHAWHLYAIRHPERERLMSDLEARGVGTLVHYPVPIHLQRAYADLGVEAGSLPIAEAAASELVSLPMFPQLTDAEVAHVCDSVNAVG
ncbi:MAG: DegT/DnrJ/EryC1/StrS family aminotransferase [Coriobacteriales bacterium]|nr:DegT/DnrJ/EryC1/StrS family aminotransferase [Coriobacteriales bacterium]